MLKWKCKCTACADYNELKKYNCKSKDMLILCLKLQLDKANAQLQEGNIPNVSGKWVSVKERLPDDKMNIVDVLMSAKLIHAGYYDKGKFYNWNGKEVYDVKAWMPLPTFPLQEAIAFEPTDEQIEQASMEYAKRNKSGKIIDVEELKAMRNFYYDTYKEIDYELKKIIGENVR